MPNTPLKGDYNTYIGARYVPIIGGMWNQQTEYEPLTIVMYQGSSFTSKTFVPKGTQIDNTTYWVRTANYDEQVEFYRSEVQQFKKDIDASEAEYIATVKKAQSEYEASITKQQNEYEASITKQQNEYEASITKQQNDYENNLTVRQDNYETKTTSEVEQFKKDIDASQAEYEASITKQQNDYENNLTVRQNNYETKTTSEVQQYKKDIDASEAEYIATVQKGQEDFNSSITKQQNDYENELTKKFSSLAQSVSAPNFVNSTSEMTDSGKIYVLMPGGDVYYYNGTTFVDSGITYSANITNLSVFRHIITVGSSDSNYSTYLPDVNDVAPNTIYILNGTLNHSHTNNPANLPYWDVFSRGIILKNYCPIQGNKSANVIQELYTMDTPEHWFRFAYLWQNKLNWTDWECVYNENLKVLKSLITVGDSNSNYTSLLPDADKAATNTIYIMTGSVHSNGTGTPANFPRWDATGQFVFKNYTTLNRNAPTNAIQELYCTTNSVRWFRFASLEQDGLVWSDWKSVGTDSGSLLSVFRHIITVGSSDSNYSTYLPDVNDVAPNTIYILNGTLNHSHTNNPANLPYWDVFSRGIILKNYCPIQGNKSANVIQELYTMDTPEHWFRFAYLWQNKLNWTDWECVYNENLKVLKSLITVGDSNSNYTSLLPDADKAATNTIYIMTGSVHSNGTGTPANFPRWDATGQFVFKNYTTLNRNAPTNAIQELYCTTNSVRWFRFASLEQDGLVWSDWKSVGTDRGSLYIKVGANEEFTSVLEAVTIAEQKMNSTVYIESGTYDIVQECKNKFGNDFFANESLQYRGIPLGNFIHIIGSSGAKLIADLTGTGFSASAIKWFSIFNSGDSNPELKNTGFTLENINATIIGGRYVVHDEHGGVLDQYTNHYKHCHFRKEKGNSAFKNVVGGGLGEHGFITFDGCTFESDIDSDTVYYHNSLYSNSGTFNSNVYFENCWFKNNSVHSDPLGTSSNKSYMYVIGCKLKSMPTGGNSDSNFEIISWNNDIT